MEEGGKGCKDYVRRASEGERRVRIIRTKIARGCEKGEGECADGGTRVKEG